MEVKMNWLKYKTSNWYQRQEFLITHCGFDYWIKATFIRPVLNISFIRAFLSYLCWKSALIQKLCHWCWPAECVECEQDLSFERDGYHGEYFQTHCRTCSYYYKTRVFVEDLPNWLKDLKLDKNAKTELKKTIELPGGNF